MTGSGDLGNGQVSSDGEVKGRGGEGLKTCQRWACSAFFFFFLIYWKEDGRLFKKNFFFNFVLVCSQLTML